MSKIVPVLGACVLLLGAVASASAQTGVVVNPTIADLVVIPGRSTDALDSDAVVIDLLTTEQPAVVVNPTTVEFIVSPDHNALGLDGAPLVTAYELRIYLGETVVASFGLSKPIAAEGSLVTFVNPLFFSPLQANTLHVARVAAIGPTGEGVSDVSNPFGNQGAPRAATALRVRR